MKFKKGDKVRHKKEGSEWYVDRIGPNGERVYCKHLLTKKGKDKTVCFLRGDLEVIRGDKAPEIFP